MTVHAVAASLLLLRVVHIIMPWRSYDLSSVVANLIVTLWFNLSKYYDLNVHARHSFLTYTALLVLHALLLHQISKSTSYEKWRHPLTAITRLATIAVIRNGLEGWTMPSQNCTADLFRFILFRHGILTQIFMTLYFPLPGLYHQAVHMISTAWFIRGNSSRVCSILLDSPHDPCGYRPWLSGVFWPKVSRAGQTLAGLMFAHLDEDRLRSLDVFGQCQVSMVWLQVRMCSMSTSRISSSWSDANR